MGMIVSVIIPTYKGADKLAFALNSVLDQTYKSLEIIVVDNNGPGSPERDRTQEIMKGYLYLDHVKYIKHPETKSRAAALNTGIAEATGRFLCFLHDKDFYLAERIEKSLESLELNPGYEGVICGMATANGRKLGSVTIPKNPLGQRNLLLDEGILGTGSNLFLSRYAVESTGGFDELFIRHQNNEFMLRVLEDFKIITLEEVLVIRSEFSHTEQLDYKNLRKLKELYMLKFEEAINRLTREERSRFYIRQYEELFFAAVRSGRKEYVIQSLCELKIFRDITLKDRWHILASQKHLSNMRIYRKLRPVYERSKKRIVTHRLKNHLDPSVKENMNKTLYNLNGLEKTQNNKF